jgi:choline dehydrogenase
MRSWLDASLESGQPFSEDMNAPDAVGIGFNPQNRVDATRVSASAAYLDGARSRPNLTVRGGATVERVVLDGDRAVGVVVDGEKVVAAEVILCAGVPYSPALLQRSGIGPAEVLRAAGIEPRTELAGVGERVMDQPVVVLMGVPAEDGAALGQPFLQLAARLAAFPGFPDEHRFYLCLFAGMEADPPVAALLRTERVHWVIAGDLAPASTGFVAVRSADAAAQPEVSLGFYGVEGDLERMRSGVRAAWELAQHPSFRPHIQRFGLVSQRVVDDEEKLDGMLRRATFSRQTFGGCAMGDVVDAACRVFGVAGLRVADASIVPVPLRAGGALTALVIGERVADAIRSGS